MKYFPFLFSILLICAAAARADSYKDAVLHDQPFAYYRLNESDSVQPVADELGRNNGKYVNVPTVGEPGAISTDHDNKAVAFNRAAAQYIELTDLGKFGSSMTGGFSFEYWLKTGNSTDHQTIFGTANGPGFITDCLVDIAYGGSKRRLRVYIRDNRESRYEADWYPGGRNLDIYDNAWHHIVHVYHPHAGNPADILRFYVDGVRQMVTVTHKGRGVPVFSNFNKPVMLGVMDLRGTTPDHLEGSLDEVAFYAHALSPEAILNHYRAAGAGEPPRHP